MDPRDVLVLSVGIERYGFSGSLPGAAALAVRFADWAMRCGVPKERVLLACNQVEEAPLPDGVRRVEPTRETLRETLVGFGGAAGGLLLVFWCGHGVLDTDDHRVLLTSDAKDGDYLNISVNEMLGYLASDGLAGRFPRQFFLIDACANFFEGMNQPARLPRDTFPKGNRREVLQFVHYSAAQGQIAEYDTIRRNSVFSTTALDWLDQNTSLPPDGAALARETRAVFDRMRRDDALRQTPIWWRIQHETGDIDTGSSGALPVSGRLDEAIRGAGLSHAQVDRITAAAPDFPGVTAAEVRDEVAAGRAGALAARFTGLASSDADRLAVQRFQDCLRRQERIAPAVSAFGAVSFAETREAYHRSAPEGDTGLPCDLEEALYLASAYGRRNGGTSPLLRMAAILEHRTGRRLDDAWYGLPADRLAALRRDTAEEPPENARLIIDLRPPGTLLFSWPGEIVGWLLLPGHGEWKKTRLSCAEASEKGVRDAVTDMLDWAYEHTALFTLGLIVTREGVDFAPESWQYRHPYAQPSPLWHEHPTVLHCAERLAHPKTIAFWKNKATAIRTQVCEGHPKVLWLEPGDATGITRVVREDAASCFGLGFPLERAGTELARDPIIATIMGGAPYLVWADRPPADWTETKERLRVLAASGAFEDLPRRLHRTRNKDPEGPCASLRLIWDAPESLPPLEELTGLTYRGRSHV